MIRLTLVYSYHPTCGGLLTKRLTACDFRTVFIFPLPMYRPQTVSSTARPRDRKALIYKVWGPAARNLGGRFMAEKVRI